MYRRLQSNFGKTKDATFTAGEIMIKGKFVVKDIANKTVNFPAANASTGIYIVDFDPEITGLLAIENNVSDYDSRCNNIASGDKVTVELLEAGEVYGTDQFIVTSMTVGGYAEVNTDGVLVNTATPTKIVVTNLTHNDAGHTLLAFTIVA